MSKGQGLKLIEPLRNLYKDEVRGMYFVFLQSSFISEDPLVIAFLERTLLTDCSAWTGAWYIRGASNEGNYLNEHALLSLTEPTASFPRAYDYTPLLRSPC
jgi:hypothetical protein